MSKPCKHCGSLQHTSFYCPKKPRTPIKHIGKVYQRWVATRKAWILANPPINDFWYCFYCGKPLTKDTLELDHYHSRSRRPDLRFTLDNLVPSCRGDNTRKGSLDGDTYIKKYYSRAATLEKEEEVKLLRQFSDKATTKNQKGKLWMRKLS